MPELAEVEWYRKQWDPGLRQKITRVSLHEKARVFRGADLARLGASLTGARLLSSEAAGKQMLFRFSGGSVLGVHLGMSGRILIEPADFEPGRHDHLVLHQRKHALVFRDPRMFGRVKFHRGKGLPDWWSGIGPAVTSPAFTTAYVAKFLKQHARLPIKAALLLQTGFPGVGNWMADEILWQARLHPRRLAGDLTTPEIAATRNQSRMVCRTALKTVGRDWADPPDAWLFHQRWKRGGECPRDGLPLSTAQVGGRTTRWCAKCQPLPGRVASRQRKRA